ncbi:restriction endonuclease subunit S [Methylobacter psychrophilus]|uniref:restriction endonuclease subunit S n=1 Tax=Methylobacter psychrophilus TaxID=96941 RepID=UPI0021D5069E|nr:restriction endonuclease subunit S [Methylobacter psychrophilus]
MPLTINQDMKVLIPASSLHGSYLLWILNVLQSHLLNMVSIAAHGTRKLETPRLESMMIQLPPLKEQLVFSERVAEIRSIQSQQTTAIAKAEAIFDVLLASCFSQPLTEG